MNIPNLLFRSCLAATFMWAATTMASAQKSTRNPLAPPLPRAQQEPPRPPVVSGIAWPRLDAGATFCRTQDDLRRRGEMAVARSAGTEASPGPAPSCRQIGTPTPITVLSRPMPSATQVQLKVPGPAGTPAQPGETGWTDTWLPEKAPR